MLVVTSVDLRAAQGHVRCGRCRSVFNALDSLSETAPQDTRPAAAPPPASTPTFEPPAPPSAADERAPPGHDAPREAEAPAEVWVEPEVSPPADPPPAAGTHEFIAPPAEPALAPAPDAHEIAPEPPAPLEPPLREASPPAEEWSEAPADFEFQPARARRSGGWLAGALLLVLVLAGQIINHYRGTLATVPSIGAKLSAVYGALGIPIVPRWNVRAYEARQLGATVSARHPHQITVRASIANRGRWPLPLPLLRVSPQDRYGRTIAARDVPPRDYAPSPASKMLPPGGRIDATVAFLNPGPQAIGFEIDACLREGIAVVCAHGPQ